MIDPQKLPGAQKLPDIDAPVSKTTAVGLWAPGVGGFTTTTATIMGRTSRVRAGAEVW